jgi:type VI secretion system protein ImpG
MFSKHYHAELSYMRESGRMYAEKHPSARSLLDERGSDPSVDRLFQTQAFLAARLRDRIDHAPEATREICAAVAPQHVRSLPACSIVEVTPEMSSMRGRRRLEAGTGMVAKPIDGTACRFRTAAPLDLLPLALERVVFQGPRTSSPLLQLQFFTSMAAKSGVFQPEGIRLFLHGDFAVTTDLWLWLLRYCRGVLVRRLDGEGPTIALGSDAVAPVGLEPELALLPWPSNGLQGARLLQEFYALPEKFLFLDIRGLDAAQAAAGQRFEIAFQLTRPMELQGPIDEATFRLNCVPVINLFRAKAKPFAVGEIDREHLLRPEGLPEGHAEVFSVDAVHGKERENLARAVYQPIASPQKAARPWTRAHYRVRRELSVLGDAVDAYLSLGLGHRAEPIPGDEVLSVDLTCTNASLPGRLRAGDLTQDDATLQASYRNIVPVTAPVLPRLSGAIGWEFVCQRARGVDAFEKASALLATLALYDFGARAQEPLHSSRKCIGAIRSSETRHIRRTLEGIPTLGTRTELAVDEAAFASRGEAFLFGSVLQELFASYLTMNSFAELEMALLPSGIKLDWAAKQGRLPLA